MGLVIVNTSLLSVPVCNQQVPSAGRDPMVGEGGESEHRSHPLGLCFYLTLVVKTRKIGPVLAFSLLKLQGICRVEVGVFLLW